MGAIESALSDHAIIGLDTSIFIYQFEAHPRYLPITTALLNGIQAGEWSAIISVITLMEINVHPWRLKRPKVARTYETLLVNFPNLQIVDVNRDVARKAAQIRAAFNLRPADSLHIATAIVGEATAWVSNDKQHRRLADKLDILILDKFV
ncbi:MAG: PIN domain-containing protein [Chloroflexota bacterium]|nr:PIN domain-containing protein [Chloroflexota bacterium]